MVDDHILIRDTLAMAINSFEQCEVILLADNGQAFIDKLQPGRLPDLVIMDLYMPVLGGYDTIKWLKQHYPEIYILVLTMYDSELALIKLIQCGVRGFLKKDIHPAELKLAIQSTMNTGYYHSYDLTGRVMNMIRKEEPIHSRMNTIVISENEMTFLKLAATDLTYKEIARQMEVSPRTIDNYRDALFLKLNVKSRVGLVLYAIKNAVIPPGY